MHLNFKFRPYSSQVRYVVPAVVEHRISSGGEIPSEMPPRSKVKVASARIRARGPSTLSTSRDFATHRSAHIQFESDVHEVRRRGSLLLHSGQGYRRDLSRSALDPERKEPSASLQQFSFLGCPSGKVEILQFHTMN